MPKVMELCRRSNLSPDGIGARIFDAVDAGEITEDEGNMLLRALLSAGLDTTISSISAALLCLARNPEQYGLLRADSALTRTALDEAIRLESPVQTFFRTTSKATAIAGVRVPADAKVMLLLAAANRDPRRWPEPDRYNLTRRTGGHVGFGTGIHRCVGEMLSRMEGEAVLDALARRCQSIRITEEPTLRYNNSLRGYLSIPLAVA